MKRWIVGGLLTAGVLLFLASCVVRTHHHRRHRHSGARVTHTTPPPEQPPPPPPDRTPPPPDRTPTHRAPPAHRAPPPPPPPPAIVVNVTPRSAKRGNNVMLHLTPMRSPVVVYFNGRPLPKRIQGNSIRVTVPGDAPVGNARIEVEWQGQRFAAPPLNVRP